MSESAGQLYRVDVTSPAVTFSLGAPLDDFGYAGVSLKTAGGYFVSINGNTRYQHNGAITTVGNQEWLQYQKRDWQVSTAETALVASGSRLMLSAGAGHYGSNDLEGGWTVAAGKFNTSDHNDIIDPVRYGVRAFDTAFTPARAAFEADLGYGPRSAAVAAQVAAVAGFADKLKAILTGTPPDPTENSPPADILSPDEPGGLIGTLQKADRVLGRLKKWISRPETAPLVGQVMEKVQAINVAYKSVLAARDAALAMVPAAKSAKPTWKKRREKMLKDADGGVEGAMNLVTTDWHQQISVPIRRLITEIDQFSRACISFLVAVKKLILGPSPRPVLGLIGKTGISMVTHQRFFGFAPDGFHFVSAPTDDAPRDWASKLQAMANALDDGARRLLGDKIIRPKAVKAAANPGFFVSVESDIRLASKRNVALSAIAPDGVAHVEAGRAAELTARDAVGISARKGAAEVLGKTVALGIPVDIAKRAALLPGVLDAAAAAQKAAKEAYDAATTALEKLRKKHEDAQKELHEINDEIDRHDPWSDWSPIRAALGGMSRGARDTKLGEIIALEESIEVAEKPIEGLNKQRQVTEDSYAALVANSGVALESKLAKAAGWKPDAQMLTESIEAAAVEKIEVFAGKKVRLESLGEVSLKTQPPGPPASVEVNTKVELAVGLFKVTVTATKVTINNGAADVLTIDATGAVITSGPTSAKLTPAALQVDAPLVEIAGKIVQLG
jgi:flagellar motility protein MotE (MotC chaperone)